MRSLRLVQGNQAAALGAIAAGCRFYAGYPITPSSEIAEEMARLMPDRGGVFVQMEDEMASLAAVIGASIAGVKAMTATSGPGFSLMQEHLGFASLAEIPCVVIDVMRAGPSTGMPTSPSQGDVMQARWGAHGDRPVIALAPASVVEVFDLTVRAFNLSERFRTPVVVLCDEVVGHTREGVLLPESVAVEDRPRPTVPPEVFLPKTAEFGDVPPLPAFGDGYRFNITGLTHDQRGFPTNDPGTAAALMDRLHRKIAARAEELVDVEEYLLEDAEVVVFAYGIVARAAKEAVVAARAEGVKAGLLRPKVLWPFPDARVTEIARRVSSLVVAEMNLGQVIGEVTRACEGATEIVPHLRADGRPITPSELLRTLRLTVRQEVAL